MNVQGLLGALALSILLLAGPLTGLAGAACMGVNSGLYGGQRMMVNS